MLKNKSMYAILGILNISPATGYEIKKYSDTVLSGFWNENFGHIYPTLKKMLKDGLIGIVSEGKIKRKICYGITEKGKQVLDAWFSEEISQQPIRSEFMLKLLFSSSQPIKNTIAMLENYKNTHKKSLDHYIETQNALAKNTDISPERARFVKAVIRRGIFSAEATIRWTDETIKELLLVDDADDKKYPAELLSEKEKG